jgi:branched-chain amino acid transport system permease protein
VVRARRWLPALSLEAVVAAALVIVGVSFAASQGNAFMVNIATIFSIWAILAVSLNLVMGYAGLLSVAHMAFFGVGAYTVAVLTTTATFEPGRELAVPTLQWPLLAALPVTMILTGLVAVMLGVVLSRFRDYMFVIVTFGFATIASSIFVNWQGVTGGAFGIRQIPKPSIGGWVLDGSVEFLAFALLLLGLVVLSAWRIVHSSFGRVIMALREDEDAIAVFGYRVEAYKLAVWVLSAMMAGLAGGLFASWTTFVDPNSFLLAESFLLMTIVIIGGLASLWGSLLGTMVFVLLNEGMRFIPFLPTEHAGQARVAILGILLVVFMLFRPQGLLGRYRL